MVFTVDGCGNCSSAARRYLDSMLHREPGTDIRQCRSTHHYIRGPLARLDIALDAAANAASRKPLQAKAAINTSTLQAPECFCHLHSGCPRHWQGHSGRQNCEAAAWYVGKRIGEIGRLNGAIRPSWPTPADLGDGMPAGTAGGDTKKMPPDRG